MYNRLLRKSISSIVNPLRRVLRKNNIKRDVNIALQITYYDKLIL